MRVRSIYFMLILAVGFSFPAYADLRFHDTKATLAKIQEIITKEQKGAYLRFGDGDVNLALGEHDALQLAGSNVMQEIQEAFLLNGSTVLKTLPLYCKEFGGYELGMSPGNHEAPYEWALNILNRARPLWGAPVEDVYSHAALAFAFSHKQDLCLQFLRFLRKSPCYLLVGNANIPRELIDLLFGPTCLFVPTPPKQSYNAMDWIERECLKHLSSSDGYKVVITSMGCSGRALQKRLWHKLDDIFLFDFGSTMDALCGWNTRAWIEITQASLQKTHFLSQLTAKTHVLYTSALIPQDYEGRKKEYLFSLSCLKQHGYPTPYIVEALSPESPSFLEQFAPVVYPKVNDFSLRNKGVNEARSMQKALSQLPFQDHDMIIKITGRYFLTSNRLLKIIEAHPTVDAFVKLDPHGQVYTGCFAMRCKFLKEFLEQLDYEKMERDMINVEKAIAIYLETIVQEGRATALHLDTLDLTANIFGIGHRHQVDL